MPVFQLTKRHIFPNPELAEEGGLLAVGGDLSEGRLLEAYSNGIFPWFSEGEPILWWSPDPRLILIPNEMKISKSLRKVIDRGTFEVTVDRVFEQVIRGCSETARKGQDGTWITDEMIEAYIRLHRAGYAHSVETWQDDELAGGLYGIVLGRGFFGESMFSRRSNASKVALAHLAGGLIRDDFLFIDCQVSTGHLKSLGAKDVPRSEFLRMLKEAINRLP